jgi:Wzt-like putative exopolysaccharide export protein
MALTFKKVSYTPLDGFNASAPDSAIVGVIGEDSAGAVALLKAAEGTVKLSSGSISGGKRRRLIGPDSALEFSGADVLLLDHTFDRRDALARAQASAALNLARRGGATILIASHDEEWLRRTCDEIWWVHQGKLRDRGDPGVIIEQWRKHLAQKMRAWGETLPPALDTHLRRGDKRAEIVSIRTVGENGKPSAVWRSGEKVEIQVWAQYADVVYEPVIGILIRNRIGLDVYGTNTQLEGLRLGPTSAGKQLVARFRFACELCAGEYTITAASHDPDGTRHDWLEEAVAITVTDTRYTAGVANLRATVTVE